MTFDPERFREINRMYAENGIPVMMPEDWEMTDATTKEILASGIPQTRNHDKRRLAAITVETYLEHGEKIDGPCILLGFDPRVPFPVIEVNDVISRYLGESYRTCDVEASIRCEGNKATEVVLRVGFGDYLCLYKCCETCHDWFSEPDRHLSENLDWPFSHPFDDRHPATSDWYRNDDGLPG